MAGFWKIALFLLTLLYPTKGHILVNLEDKLAECVLTAIGTLNSPTIRISIEAEDPIIRRHFEDTVSRLLAESDAILLDLESCGASISIFFVDSSTSFKNLIVRQRSRECHTSSASQYYFVVLPNSVLLEEILNFCWKAYILNVNVLVEDENEIVTLYTYYPFTKSKCRDSTPTIHNRFINGSFEWNKELFPNKINNFWQCPIKAIVFDNAPYVWVRNNQIYGLNAQILKTLAAMMNFSIEIVISPEGRGTYSINNNSATGTFKMLKDGVGEIIAGGAGLLTERRGHFAVTDSFYTGYMYALVKRPKLYRSLDALLLPFDWIMWFSLSTLLLGKWICLLLWKKWSNRFLAFRYCSTRLHTVGWLYAMFIVRISYEGSIFRCLQNRPIAWVPENIDEAINNGYKFLLSHSYYTRFKDNPQLKDHLILDNNISLLNMATMLDTYEGNYAVLSADIVLRKFYEDPSNYEKYVIIPKPVIVLNYCMEMQKHSFLIEVINTKIKWLLANGYMERHYVEHVKMKKFMNNNRAVISLHHIKGAFIFLAMCMVVNIFVFLAELLSESYPWLKRLFKLFN